MMDVVLLPERKKPNFLRATKEQLDILTVGFEASDISSQPHLTALSEATGLPTKWIASWFTRQRKKAAVASGRYCPRIQKNSTAEGTKSHEDTTITMSIQDIAAFKMEHSEHTLPDTLVPPVNPKPEDKPVPVKKSVKKTRKSMKKRISDPALCPNSPSSPPLKLPSTSQLQLSRIQAQPQPADRPSLSSTFILREMVPVAYKPQSPNPPVTASLSTTTIDPQLSETSSPDLSAKCSLVATASNAIAPLRPDAGSHSHSVISLDTNCNFKALSAEPVAPHLGIVHPWQDTITESPQGNSKKNKEPAQESAKGCHTLKPCASTSTQKKPTERPLRPLLPLNPPSWNAVPTFYQYLPHYNQALPGISQTQDDKENQLPYPQLPASTPRTSSKLRSSGPQTLAPLFTSTDLTFTSARSIQSTTIGAIPTSVATWAHTSQQHSFVQTTTQPPEFPSAPVEQNENELSRLDDQPISSFFDSTTTPLKHLDVLAPFPDENLPMDEIMNRLLDSQLAAEDPFQAAMGLVFASQLGLNWDHT